MTIYDCRIFVRHLLQTGPLQKPAKKMVINDARRLEMGEIAARKVLKRYINNIRANDRSFDAWREVAA